MNTVSVAFLVPITRFLSLGQAGVYGEIIITLTSPDDYDAGMPQDNMGETVDVLVLGKAEITSLEYFLLFLCDRWQLRLWEACRWRLDTDLWCP
jgi:hypothetical protein